LYAYSSTGIDYTFRDKNTDLQLLHHISCTTFCCFNLVKLNVSLPVIDCDKLKIAFSSNGKRTQCQLDHGYFRYCSSPYSQSGLRGGKHTVTIRATDGHGGYKQKSVTFIIVLGMLV